MATSLKLLILALMATAAITRGHLCGNSKSVVFFALLVRGRLMTIETSDTLLAMPAHLVFMHN
jgi:hypothetical protein